jgi:hypothetical protein
LIIAIAAPQQGHGIGARFLSQSVVWAGTNLNHSLNLTFFGWLRQPPNACYLKRFTAKEQV